MKYRKKPIVIEAFRFGFDELPDWFVGFIDNSRDKAWAYIETLEGEMTAKSGDYIIKGIKGELYPCKEDVFEATYEKVIE